MKQSLLFAACAILALAAAPACTDLEPEICSDVLKDNYYKTPEQFATLLANAYAQLAGEQGYVYREGYWSMQEYTSDEVAVPTRGTEWADNGVPLAMNRHQWEVNTRDINNGWSFAYGGVTKCNDVLDQIAMIKGNDPSQYDAATRFGVAETKVLRAFYHLLAMDLYGNVPIVDGSGTALRQSSREEVFEFIEREIASNLDYLEPTPSYGRVTRSVGETMLAKLYLNAEIYTGTPRWHEAAVACSEVISGGYGYALEPNYFAPFAVNNTGCREIIFPVVFDAVKAQGNMFHLMTLHYVQQEVFQFTTQTWNGPCTHQAFYDAYADADVRKAQWFVGEIKDKAGNLLHFKKGSVDAPAVIVPTISATADATEKNTFDGARFVKFEIEPGIGHHANNDFPIYRLSDIYLMQAEALMRLNGNAATAEALAAVNAVRMRTGLPPYTAATLTLNELLAERGRELAWEGHRRQDLIRFGAFNNAWGQYAWGVYKPASDPHRCLFPIPKWVTDAAPGVYTQNAGY